jgi:predicted metalloprotease with PDZ domain
MDPIRYTLSFPAPHTHYVHIRAEVPAAGRDSVELSMAVWTPGSYLVREFSRHVESVTAESPGGIALRVEKTAKNRWRVATGGALMVIVSYRVYGREMSVRTNWIESDFAFVNGAPTFLTLAGEPRRPHEVSIVPASGWTRSITALRAGRPRLVGQSMKVHPSTRLNTNGTGCSAAGITQATSASQQPIE